MKSVLIIRHAKSSWDNLYLPDFDRPLNERGKLDAPKMARRLLEKKIVIDAFISSPAKRARKTATLFAAEYGLDKEQVILVPELYHAAIPTFYQAITGASEKADSIAIFSHNPGITDFVNDLTDVRIDDMPTCSIFAITADIQYWKDFEEAGKKFWFFDYPKSSSGI